MDAKSVALIAERMKWSHTDENGPEWYVTHENYKEYDVVAETNSVTGEWHLTSAGAFEVLVEMEIGLNKVNGMYQANYRLNGTNNVTGTLGEQSPHEIVALAALAMIEEEG